MPKTSRDPAGKRTRTEASPVLLLRFNTAGNHVSPVLYSLEYRKEWKKIGKDYTNWSLFMSHDNCNCNSKSNWYITLADKEKVEEISLRTIFDNSKNSSKESSGGDTNQNKDAKKKRVEITWCGQFKYYC